MQYDRTLAQTTIYLMVHLPGTRKMSFLSEADAAATDAGNSGDENWSMSVQVLPQSEQPSNLSFSTVSADAGGPGAEAFGNNEIVVGNSECAQVGSCGRSAAARGGRNGCQPHRSGGSERRTRH